MGCISTNGSLAGSDGGDIAAAGPRSQVDQKGWSNGSQVFTAIYVDCTLAYYFNSCVAAQQRARPV